MANLTPRHIAALRGAGRLATAATTGVTDLVQALHTRIAATPTRLAGPLVGGAISGTTGLVYGAVRGVTKVVGSGIDRALTQLAPLLEERDELAGGPTVVAGTELREALRAALNGVLGDYLAYTGNPLAITMSLRQRGAALPLERELLSARVAVPQPRLLVLVHGLCMNDLQWARRAASAGAAPHDHGAALSRDLPCSALYLHYNSGLHVSVNGRQFAAQLEALVAAWPVPVQEILILGHSMGGLVARSAVHAGLAAGHEWPQRLRAMVFLGTPHHGSPLERGGHWIDQLLQSTPYTAPFARLGKIRSAGITDLRHGSVLDDDWSGRDRFAHGHDARRPLPLPAGVDCYALAATTAPAPGTAEVTTDPVGSGTPSPDALPGDGLVPVASALGQHADHARALDFEASRHAIAWHTGHLDLLSSLPVYHRIRDWLAS
jgi:hypothetical protein